MNGLTTISVSIVECSWEQSSIYIPYTNINKNTEDVELNCIVTNIDTSIVCLHATCDLIYLQCIFVFVDHASIGDNDDHCRHILVERKTVKVSNNMCLSILIEVNHIYITYLT